MHEPAMQHIVTQCHIPSKC